MQAPNFHRYILPDWLVLPKGRGFDQDMVGMLPTIPGLWLLALAVPALFLAMMSAIKGNADGVKQPQRKMLLLMILCAAAGQFVFLAVFFYAAERYILDFYLPLILVLAGVIWYLDEAFNGKPVWRLVLWLTTAALVVWTIGIYFFGSFSVRTGILRYYDPALIAGLADCFNNVSSGLRSVLGSLAGFLIVLVP